MIFVDRSRVTAPDSLSAPTVSTEFARAEEFFSLRRAERAQREFSFIEELWTGEDVRGSVRELFREKCAYCESAISFSLTGNVQHHRPPLRAVGLHGAVAPEHYWWLAFAWDNLYLVCARCTQHKSARFPVLGRRAKMTASGDTLAKEQPLLLDPCVDKPTEHLVFDDDGWVIDQSHRGRVTIDILGLNRDDLVFQRRELCARLRKHLAATGRTPQLGNWTGPERPYSAVARQVIYRWAVGRGKRWYSTYESTSRTVTPERLEPAAEIPATAPVTYSVESSADAAKEAYYRGAQKIERIEVRNCKGIEQLDLQFPQPLSTQEPWLVLLGENGTGKSSLLQGVALALMGETHANSLGLDARRFARRGMKSGFVRVHLTSQTPVVLQFTSDSPRFSVKPPEPRALLLGYGATRLLRGIVESDNGQRYIRVKNLFDPTVHFANAESWLSDESRVDQRRFDEVAITLKDLLMMGETDRFIRENGGVYVLMHDTRVGIEELSDGFQSVVALALDIMMALFERWSSMKVAEGVVILDEIEVHLHPTWKIEIVARLRRCFPRVTFLVTTHDPLCLKGLSDGEVVVLRRDQLHRVQANTDLPPLEHLRADQILTSPFFGLASTRGGATQDKTERYAELHRLGRDRSLDQEQEFRALAAELSHAYAAGETSAAREAEELLHQTLTDIGRVLDPDEVAGLSPEVQVELKAQLEKLLSL